VANESHTCARRSSPVEIPETARATVESRVLSGEASAAELLHHLAGARDEALLHGVLWQVRGLLEILIELVEAERAEGNLANLALQHIDVAIGIVDGESKVEGG
jgi:hypothetical protein